MGSSNLPPTVNERYQMSFSLDELESYPELLDFAKTAYILNDATIQIEVNIEDTGKGDSESSLALCEQRAKAVAQRLQSQGIDPSRLVIIWNEISIPVEG